MTKTEQRVSLSVLQSIVSAEKICWLQFQYKVEKMWGSVSEPLIDESGLLQTFNCLRSGETKHYPHQTLF